MFLINMGRNLFNYINIAKLGNSRFQCQNVGRGTMGIYKCGTWHYGYL